MRTMERPQIPREVYSWSDARLSNVAHRLTDVLDTLGRYVKFGEWKGRFCPDTEEDSARRRWERWKAELRACGLQFSLVSEWGREEEGMSGKPSPLGLPKAYQAPKSVLIESTAHGYAVAEALIGPMVLDEDLGKRPTRTIFDFFPEDTHEDVEWLIEEMAQELLAERTQNPDSSEEDK